MMYSAEKGKGGLHTKTTKSVRNGAKSVGVAEGGGKGKIVLGMKNRGTSKLDGLTAK